MGYPSLLYHVDRMNIKLDDIVYCRPDLKSIFIIIIIFFFSVFLIVHFFFSLPIRISTWPITHIVLLKHTQRTIRAIRFQFRLQIAVSVILWTMYKRTFEVYIPISISWKRSTISNDDSAPCVSTRNRLSWLSRERFWRIFQEIFVSPCDVPISVRNGSYTAGVY
jgi:hypothetical protein